MRYRIWEITGEHRRVVHETDNRWDAYRWPRMGMAGEYEVEDLLVEHNPQSRG